MLNNINVCFDFLPFVEDIYKLCKNNIQLLTLKDHPQYQNTKSTWPGLRSLEISESEPFLFLHIIDVAKQKLNFKPSLYAEIKCYIHLRLEQNDSEDWVHKDGCDTLLIYLSETNLSSGTSFYSEEKEEIAKVSFLQNTAIFFDGNINHKSLSNYGNSLDNGRMTINIFCYKK